MPFLCAAASARAMIGSCGPAKLILMTRAPFSLAHSRPLRMLKVVPSALAPFGSKARTARMRARGATPVRRDLATMAPAMPVPCECGAPSPPAGLKLSAMVSTSSGWFGSMPESITATRTVSPLASSCARGSFSFSTEYWMPSPVLRLLQGVAIIRLHRQDGWNRLRGCGSRSRHCGHREWSSGTSWCRSD